MPICGHAWHLRCYFAFSDVLADLSLRLAAALQQCPCDCHSEASQLQYPSGQQLHARRSVKRGANQLADSAATVQNLWTLETGLIIKSMVCCWLSDAQQRHSRALTTHEAPHAAWSCEQWLLQSYLRSQCCESCTGAVRPSNPGSCLMRCPSGVLSLEAHAAQPFLGHSVFYRNSERTKTGQTLVRELAA